MRCCSRCDTILGPDDQVCQDCGARQTYYAPTRLEIMAECLVIQATWLKRERVTRTADGYRTQQTELVEWHGEIALPTHNWW